MEKFETITKQYFHERNRFPQTLQNYFQILLSEKSLMINDYVVLMKYIHDDGY